MQKETINLIIISFPSRILHGLMRCKKPYRRMPPPSRRPLLQSQLLRNLILIYRNSLLHAERLIDIKINILAVLISDNPV